MDQRNNQILSYIFVFVIGVLVGYLINQNGALGNKYENQGGKIISSQSTTSDTTTSSAERKKICWEGQNTGDCSCSNIFGGNIQSGTTSMEGNPPELYCVIGKNKYPI